MADKVKTGERGPDSLPFSIAVKEIDLRKGRKSDHPDILPGRQYLVKIGDGWFFGRFTRQHYGLNFTNWGMSGCQFDTPGYNASQWKRVIEIEPDAIIPGAGCAAEATVMSFRFKDMEAALEALNPDIFPANRKAPENHAGNIVVPDGYALVPVKPSRGLLVSMAIRQNHAFLIDLNPDDPLSPGVNPLFRENILASMAQLYEEAIGKGFHSPGRDHAYAESVSVVRPSEAAAGDGAPAEGWMARATAAEARVKALEQAVARKDAALRPFADFADDMDADGRDLRDGEGIYAFKAGDFRKAREACGQEPESGNLSDSETASSPDLTQLCAEIREWWNKGVLREGSALGRLARKRFGDFGDDAIRFAETHVMRQAVSFLANGGQPPSDANGKGAQE